ncbi:hypothetical protein AN963_02130 [Brevibacillus choshinensis]|uniref:Uncharacterized protein n=1 Tax=Brevibacillus choshinensis TaxID=54911 RepID=A0ABR5NAP3_BRECH|nr:hypothetical protein AN963_02130 [Brevibacillus choshinensis]
MSVNALSPKTVTTKPFLTEHSFGRKSKKLWFFSLTPPRCLAIIRRNTLYSDNNNIEKIVIIAGYDEEDARQLFNREPGLLRTG